MASRVLDSRTMKPLQPATSLWKQYDPAAAPRAFEAESAAEARRWQRTTRRALAGLLRLEAEDGTAPATRCTEGRRRLRRSPSAAPPCPTFGTWRNLRLGQAFGNVTLRMGEAGLPKRSRAGELDRPVKRSGERPRHLRGPSAGADDSCRESARSLWLET